MKYLVFILLFLATGTNTYASLKWYKESVAIDQKEDKKEISEDELPQEVKHDIVKNYHNATVVHAYKTSRNGEDTGYIVQLKKGPEEWTVNYDKNGDPENKINPIKQ